MSRSIAHHHHRGRPVPVFTCSSLDAGMSQPTGGFVSQLVGVRIRQPTRGPNLEQDRRCCRLPDLDTTGSFFRDIVRAQGTRPPRRRLKPASAHSAGGVPSQLNPPSSSIIITRHEHGRTMLSLSYSNRATWAGALEWSFWGMPGPLLLGPGNPMSI